MKKQVIILLVFFCCNMIMAQYLPVVSTSKTTFLLKQEVLDATIPGTIVIDKDTLVNSQSYKMVRYQAGFFPSSYSTAGYVRQSADNSKLYFFDLKSNQEYQVMNLDLNIGDQISIYFTPGCEIVQGNNIAQVVEVYFRDNRKHIVFDRMFGSGLICDSLKFIEGFGPNASIFFQTPLIDNEFPGLAYKVCRKLENDLLSYPISGNDFCGASVNTQNIPEIGTLRLYPNPVSDEIFIDFDNMPLPFEKSIISICDLNGQVLLHKKHDPLLGIYVGDLKSGLYVAKIVSDKFVASQKFQKL